MNHDYSKFAELVKAAMRKAPDFTRLANNVMERARDCPPQVCTPERTVDCIASAMASVYETGFTQGLRDYAETVKLNSPSYKSNEDYCSSCRFLGGYLYDGDVFDLYFCSDGLEDSATVIARFGEDGSDYVSGLDLAEASPALKEAKARAINKGFIT